MPNLSLNDINHIWAAQAKYEIIIRKEIVPKGVDKLQNISDDHDCTKDDCYNDIIIRRCSNCGKTNPQRGY